MLILGEGRGEKTGRPVPTPFSSLELHLIASQKCCFLYVSRGKPRLIVEVKFVIPKARRA